MGLLEGGIITINSITGRLFPGEWGEQEMSQTVRQGHTMRAIIGDGFQRSAARFVLMALNGNPCLGF